MTRLSCPGADRAFTPRWRDDEAPSETEPLEPSDAPDHTDDSPQASGRDRAASLEVVVFAVGSAALISLVMGAQAVSDLVYR